MRLPLICLKIDADRLILHEKNLPTLVSYTVEFFFNFYLSKFCQIHRLILTGVKQGQMPYKMLIKYFHLSTVHTISVCIFIIQDKKSWNPSLQIGNYAGLVEPPCQFTPSSGALSAIATFAFELNLCRQLKVC